MWLFGLCRPSAQSSGTEITATGVAFGLYVKENRALLDREIEIGVS